MKKKIILLGLLSSMLLVACNNETSSSESDNSDSAAEQNNTDATEKNSENLFDSNAIEKGIWISQNGDIVEKDGMILSEPIEYNPEYTYLMNETAYITYLNDDKIIKTLLMEEDRPITLETVKEADNIKVNFNEIKLENFELTTK